MAEWYVRLRDAFKEQVVGEYTLREPTCEIKNSEGGGFTGEIALGQTRRQSPNFGITRDAFAPKRTWYELWRHSTGAGVCVSDGYLTSVNLNRDRDTILIAGEDWKNYLDKRIYPFEPRGYLEYDENKAEMYWDKWPKKWVIPTGDLIASKVSVERIVRDLLLSMRTGRPIDIKTPNSVRTQANYKGVPTFPIAINDGGDHDMWYKVYPGDQTTIMGHINALSEGVEKGFEWDLEPITRTFRMWQPYRYPNSTNPVFHFVPSALESGGMVVDFDWTNEGPAGTFLFGLGAAERTGYKVGQIWSYEPALEQFGRYDLVYDYGTMTHPETLLDRLKDQNDIWPQKKLTFSLLNPEFLPMNFYTGGRPRNLIGNTVRVTKDFPPYHKVDAYFRINSMSWQVDESTNEIVDLVLMMVYEPETGSSGGINAKA